MLDAPEAFRRSGPLISASVKPRRVCTCRGQPRRLTQAVGRFAANRA